MRVQTGSTTRKFKAGDIVTFYESIHPWIVEGYVSIGPYTDVNGITHGWEQRVSIKRIELPSAPHLKAIPGYAEESDLILS